MKSRFFTKFIKNKKMPQIKLRLCITFILFTMSLHCASAISKSNNKNIKKLSHSMTKAKSKQEMARELNSYFGSLFQSEQPGMNSYNIGRKYKSFIANSTNIEVAITMIFHEHTRFSDSDPCEIDVIRTAEEENEVYHGESRYSDLLPKHETEFNDEYKLNLKDIDLTKIESVSLEYIVLNDEISKNDGIVTAGMSKLTKLICSDRPCISRFRNGEQTNIDNLLISVGANAEYWRAVPEEVKRDSEMFFKTLRAPAMMETLKALTKSCQIKS